MKKSSVGDCKFEQQQQQHYINSNRSLLYIVQLNYLMFNGFLHNIFYVES